MALTIPRTNEIAPVLSSHCANVALASFRRYIANIASHLNEQKSVLDMPRPEVSIGSFVTWVWEMNSKWRATCECERQSGHVGQDCLISLWGSFQSQRKFFSLQSMINVVMVSVSLTQWEITEPTPQRLYWTSPESGYFIMSHFCLRQLIKYWQKSILEGS